MPALSKRTIDALVPPESGQLLVWDDELKGFAVRVMPTGVKSYVVQYRNRQGASRRTTIGKVDARLTATEARRQALQILAAAGRGEDPLEEERAARRKLADVNALLDRYLEDYVRVHNAKTTQAEWTRIVDRHLRPALGKLKVEEVRGADLARLHAKMLKTPRVANLMLAVASKAFALAELWGYRPAHSNPARGIRKFPEVARKTKLNEDQLWALGSALREAETIGLPWLVGDEPSKHLPLDWRTRRTKPDAFALAALRMLLFTGARLSEILTLERNHVDQAAGTIGLPGKKGGERRPQPIGPAALALLKGLPSIEGSPWVFPRLADPNRSIAKEVVEGVWQKVRHRAGLPGFRIHDLRHAFGTFAGARGANAFLVRDVMRHENISMTSRYVAAEDDPVRRLTADVEGRILGWLGEGAVPKGGKARR